MSVASFSGGHVEGAYTMHLCILQSNSEQTRCFTSVILPIQPRSTHCACTVPGAGFQRRVISSKRDSFGEWIRMRLHLVALDKWCADPPAIVSPELSRLLVLPLSCIYAALPLDSDQDNVFSRTGKIRFDQ